MTSKLECVDSKPQVSIGLPVYNGEKYLREAVDSLLRQSFRDFELIISDNASTDSTPEIILAYQRRDPRIKFIRQTANIGAAQNFIYVLAESKAELFMWASHDDIWADNWLETLVNNINSDDVGVRGKLLLMKNGSILACKMLPNFRKGDFLRCFLRNENDYRSHYTYSLFHRNRLLAADFDTFNADYYPDALFVYNVLHQGALRTIPETHIVYRLHDHNAGMQYSLPWKGWKKILYRIHPFRYYQYYLRFTKDFRTRMKIAALIPFKHFYAQTSFWVRGFRELITGKKAL